MSTQDPTALSPGEFGGATAPDASAVPLRNDMQANGGAGYDAASTSGASPDAISLVNGISQNQNTNGSSFPLPTNLNTVDATKVGTPAITTPVVPPSSSGTGLANYVGTTADAIKAEMDKTNANLQDQITSGEATDTTLGSNLQDIYAKLAGVPAESNAIYNANGVPQAQKMVTDLTTAINSEKVATAEQIKQLQETGGGGTVGGVNTEISRVQNDSSFRLANLGIALSAASGNWQNAQSISDRQIAAITQPLQTALDSTKYFYTANKDSLNAKESQLYTNKIDQLNTALKVTTDAAVTLQAAKNDAMKTAVTMVATSDQIMKIQNAQNYDELGSATGAINGATSSTTGTGAGTAAKTIASGLGIQDTTQPLVNVLAQFGVDNVVNQIIKNENSQLDAKYNNPGDIKFNNMPGQTDSGVTASDGGTFASYATPDAGRKAIADMVTRVASNTAGTSYADTPSAQNGGKISFEDFVNKYTNTAPSAAVYAQYGKLANTDFNPNLKPDQNANAYLTSYLKSGTVPTPSQLGISTRSGAGQSAYSKAQTRANDLFFQATGTSLPSPEVLKGNLALINANNKLVNNLGVQESTITKNFGLNLQNLNANNINQSVPVLNAIFNAIDTTLGQPGTAQYNLQNATLQQEAGNLMAVKNATGTTVYDKMVGAGLIPKNASAAVQATLMKTLLQEAMNAKTSINEVNANLYSQVDPLEQDPNNPNRQSSGTSVQTLSQTKGFNYQAAKNAGYTDDQILTFLNSQ